MVKAASVLEETPSIVRRVKVSSKRQITIPVDIYERQGFSDYALISEAPDGIVVQPFNLADEDEELTIRLLRHLMSKGLEGEDLLAQYAELKPKFASYAKAIKRSEDDIAHGRLIDFDDMQASIRGTHGL